MQTTETVSTFDSPRSLPDQQEARHINFGIVYAAIKRGRWKRQHSDPIFPPAS